jgi:voltage-gated potassium channel Kch
VRRWWASYHWWIVAVLALATVVLGVVGFRASLGVEGRSSWYFLYLSLQLFALESGSLVTGPAPVSLEVARLLAPAISAYGIAAVIAGFFRDELVGLRTRYRRGHAIVCGLEAGWAMVRELAADGWRPVAIERDGEHPRVDACRSLHIPVFVGDARDDLLLRKAGVRRAERLFAVCDDDAINIKIAEKARRSSEERRRLRIRRPTGPLRVLVHTADPYLAELLTMQELERPGSDAVRLDFFSIHAGGARALLSQYPGRLVAGQPPHIAVVGLGRLGRQIVVQAARNWRLDRPDGEPRPWITVVDEDADRKVDLLLKRHPLAGLSCDVRSVELPPDPLRLIHEHLFEPPECPAVSTVFVCLPDDATALGVGLALHEEMKHRGVPVVVRIYDADITSLVRLDDASGGLQVFDQIDHTCRPDQLFAGVRERLAQAMHGAYLRQRLAAGDTPATNPSIVPWEQLPEDKKESNRQQAAHVSVKLEAVGCELGPLTDSAAERFLFEPDEVALLSELEHERWRAWAPVDHPDKVPWDELTDEMREVDREFVRRLPALVATVGFQINRVRPRQPVLSS